MWIFLSVVIIMFGMVIRDVLYFEHSKNKKVEDKFNFLNKELDRKLIEFEETKKKVDSMSIRMGFK